MSDIVLIANLHPVVKFKKEVDEQDIYIVSGMYARLIKAVVVEEDFAKVWVSLKEFDEVNTPLETHDWYGPNNELMSAREVGCYNEEETVCIDPTDWGRWFEVVSDNPFMQQYLEREDKTQPYTDWLEQNAQKVVWRQAYELFMKEGLGAITTIQQRIGV